MTEFLIFGLLLNVGSFVLHFILTGLSAARLGLMKTFEISQISLKVFGEYNTLMKKHYPFVLLFEHLALFIPFYLTWQYVEMVLHYKREMSYFELPVIFKIYKLEKLKESLK